MSIAKNEADEQPSSFLACMQVSDFKAAFGVSRTRCISWSLRFQAWRKQKLNYPKDMLSSAIKSRLWVYTITKQVKFF